MNKEKIWFALVEIKSVNNKILDKDKGAFVNVAYYSESKDELLDRISMSFEDEGFKVVEVDEIEKYCNLSIDSEDAEKLSLLKDLVDEGYDYSWGVYHTFILED